MAEAGRNPGLARVATAFILAPALWAAIKLAPAPVFHALALGAILLASWECYTLLETWGARPFKVLGAAAGLAVAWSCAGLPPGLGVELPLALFTILTVLVAMGWRSTPQEMLRSTLGTLFPVSFVALALGYLGRLRGMPGEDGPDLVLLLFVCVIFADSSAYYAGRAIGRHPMAPVLSPRKTWEGGAAGLVGSMGGALLAHAWFYQRLPIAHALALGVGLAIAGTLGDVAVSMVKRAAGAKDSSQLLPGHGGLLDRTDSLLFSSPLLYYYYRLFLQGVS